MSRLIDKLTKSRQADPQPMGFMLTRTTSEKSRLQLVVSVSAEALEKFASELSRADGLILDIARADDIAALEKVSQAKDGPTAGGRLKTSSAGTVKKALNCGCDFMVFSTQAPLSVTKDEKLGKIIEISSGLSDILLRTLGDLPVDAVIAMDKDAEETLTLSRLMEIQRLCYLINKPLLVSVPLSFSTEDLQALYDAGVLGVVSEVVDAKAAEKLADLRSALEKVKKTAPRKKDKMSAILPRLQAEAPQVEQEEEEDE